MRTAVMIVGMPVCIGRHCNEHFGFVRMIMENEIVLEDAMVNERERAYTPLVVPHAAVKV
jgi:hypothetical protein